MIPYNSGDVVLVRFPFTDLQSSKKRPALIVNPPSFGTNYGDIVVLALTSQDQQDGTLKLAGWKAAGLPKPTWVKALIGTLSNTLVVRRMGALDKRDYPVVTSALKMLVANEFWGK